MFKSIAIVIFYLLLMQPTWANNILNDLETKKTIARVQQYLTKMTTAKSRFVQVNHDGSYYEGDMYISRPGRMRFEYDAPIPILLIADSYFLIHIDKELEATTRIPIIATPVNFLLQDKVNFDKDVKITNFSNQDGVIRIELVQKNNPDAGSLTIALNDNPLLLRQWVVVDPQRIKTIVTLINPEFGMKLNPRLFIHHDKKHNNNN